MRRPTTRSCRPAGLKHNATTAVARITGKRVVAFIVKTRQGGEDLHSDLPLRPAAGALLGTLVAPLGVEPLSREGPARDRQ